MNKRRIVVLGSTGSIGESAFRVLSHASDRFEVIGLAARSRIDRLAEQAKELHAKIAVTSDAGKLAALQSRLPAGVEAAAGDQALIELVTRPDVDIVLCAIVGTGGLLPVLAALRAGKRVALASKEVMVMAGELVNRVRSEHPAAELIPVDSEHSALFQCLAGRHGNEVEKLILTASGGAFRDADDETIRRANAAEALRHPTWSMGPKVTVDSASLMNKALELIEARHLFNFDPDRLDVLIHPESVVHSLISLADGAMIAQMSMPDMRFAIQYALSYPERFDGALPKFDFARMPGLHFREVDHRRFPAIGFARRAMAAGGTLPAVMNAANEVAVESFLQGRIAFPEIWSIIEKTMERHQVVPQSSLEEIFEADRWSRSFAASLI